MYMGTQGENGENTHCTAVYLCTSFSGAPKADGKEMHGALFLPPDTLDEQFGDNLFPPFAASLKMPKSAQIMQTLSMDISDGCGIIKEDQDRPGAPDNNTNAKGPHKKRGHILSPKERKKLSKRLVGQTSSKGITVSGISKHCFDRVGQRMMSPNRIEQMLASSNTKPDPKHKDRTLYDIPGSRLVLSDDGTIVSVMWRKNNK